MQTTTVITSLVLATASAHADVTLSALFADHMVLQRDIPAAVYGMAEPGENVTVAFAGQTQTATADNGGGWGVELAAMKACTNPAVMTVSGKNKLTLNDVVVGKRPKFVPPPLARRRDVC